MFATSLAILSVTYRDAAERGAAFAAFGASIGAFFAICPLVGGALTSAFGWRAVFRAGQLTLTAGMFLLVLGLLRGNVDEWGSTEIVAELLGGAVALAGCWASVSSPSTELSCPREQRSGTAPGRVRLRVSPRPVARLRGGGDRRIVRCSPAGDQVNIAPSADTYDVPGSRRQPQRQRDSILAEPPQADHSGRDQREVGEAATWLGAAARDHR